MDGDPVGPNYSFAFPFEVKAKDLEGKFGELVELKDKEFRFKDKLTDGIRDGRADRLRPEGRDAPAVRDAARAERRAGRVSAQTYPFAKFNVWGIKTTICPEPFMPIENLKPGERKWVIVYRFTHDPPKKK